MCVSETSKEASEKNEQRHVDDLAFHGSPDPTIGVELELAVLDKEDFHLAPGAPRILKSWREDGIQGLASELMQSMLEVRTDVCTSVSEVRQQLFERLERARNIATSLGYDLGMFGTHPFQRINASALTQDERYERIANKLGWITYHRVAFGLHVHIGVRSGDEAIACMNIVSQYLPHLLAISANSPFWQGVDTGLASCRAVLYGLVAHSGVPYQFEGWKDFRTYCQIMRDGNAIQSFKGIKWDIRPRPEFGTLEFRICDTPASLKVALALAAMIRALVKATSRLLATNPEAHRSDRRLEWITAENKWLAARYGLDAIYIRTPSGKRGALRQELTDVVEQLLPFAQEGGDDEFLASVLPFDEFEAGADRQRSLYRQHGEWQSLIRDSITQLGEEVKRWRASQMDHTNSGTEYHNV